MKRVENCFRVMNVETKTCWLSDEEACDIYFSEVSCGTVEKVIRRELIDKEVDLAAQPRENRRKRLLLADMDSTIVTTETIDQMAEHIGLKDIVSEITARAMNGELPFEKALKDRAKMLKGVDVNVINEVISELEFSAGAKVLIKTMSEYGAYTALVSGGFRYFTKHVRDTLGFSCEYGNELEIIDKKITGKLIGKLITPSKKRQIFFQLLLKHKLNGEQAIAIGDGANDLPMLKAAGLGVAYHAKPNVTEAARYRIDHAGLHALLFLQGVKKKDFVY